MLTVYGRANSSNVRKVLWTLDELGLPYERLDYGRGFEPTDSAAYKAINPAGLVPALQDGDTLIGESNVIIRYLLRKADAVHILPTHHGKLARVEQWMDWQSAEMVRPFRILFMGGHLDMPPFNTAEHLDLAHGEATKFMGILNDQLSQTGAYIVGDTFSAADLAAGVYVHRWFALDIERPAHAALEAYYNRLATRPAYMTHVKNGLP